MESSLVVFASYSYELVVYVYFAKLIIVHLNIFIMEMSKDALRKLCKEHKLYLTPTLNDKLYCNCKGFVSISHLEEYINVKSLFLEGNCLESLCGIPQLPQLRCL